MPRGRIPDVVVKRLPVYLRALREAQAEGLDIVSSAELSERTGISSEQIRKDLTYFGAFGTRGVGYATEVLADRIQKILGLCKPVPVALVGAGHLGTALARYNRSQDHLVQVAAIFDHDPEKIGSTIAGISVYHPDQIQEVVQEKGIQMAILAIPPQEAQGVADRLALAGVKSILNFSPAKIRSKAHVQNIDLTLELQTLAYYTMGDGNA